MLLGSRQPGYGKNTRDVASQLDPLVSLIEAYRESRVTIDTSELQFGDSDEELFQRYSPTGRGSTVGDVLPMKINRVHHEQGWIYIFNWPKVPSSRRRIVIMDTSSRTLIVTGGSKRRP